MIYDKYEIVQDSAFGSMYRIKPTGKGGSIPTVLSGMYTTTSEAVKSIDRYTSSFKQKVKSNATKLSDG